MANHTSAEKRNRQTKKRTATNKSRTSRTRTFVKKVEEAIASGDYKAAQKALKEAQPEIMRSVSKGLIKLNTASRKISRLSSRVKAIAPAK